ncbi:MAG: dihydrofolate reductase [Planctomycetes bacterium]|nr:dihydrofolate reductase [Planctomycetota bacterium]
MKVTLIAAMARDRVIGRQGRVPWHLPEDLKRFRRRTTGHAVIMGRKTFESIGKLLPKRRSIVITRQSHFLHPDVQVACSLEAALALAGHEEDEIFIAGGEQIYQLALPGADRLDLTFVDAPIAGDVYFPPFNSREWRLISEEQHEADERHAHAYSFRVYERCESRPD